MSQWNIKKMREEHGSVQLHCYFTTTFAGALGVAAVTALLFAIVAPMSSPSVPAFLYGLAAARL